MHKPRHRWVFGWALALLGLIACASSLPRQLPLLARPDTRFVLGARIDSTQTRRIAALLADSLPRENGLCLSVEITDSAVGLAVRPVVTVVGVTQAGIFRADIAHVWFQQWPYHNGCRSDHQFAMAHSHPYSVAPRVCTNSRDDEVFLASDPRLLFSLIFCGDGRAEILWQDGERDAFRWYTEPAAQ